MKKSLLSVLLVGVVLALASPATAQVVEEPKGLLDVDRLTVAVGLDYAWYSKDPESGALPFQKEFELSANLAWNLTPHLDLVGGTAWGLDNQVFRTRLGARLTLKAAH